MFAYCNNNPVMMHDVVGNIPDEILDTDGDGEADCYVYSYTFSTGTLWWKKDHTGYVYIYTGRNNAFFDDASNTPNAFNNQTDIMVGDYTNSNNPTMYAYRADRLQNKHRDSVLSCMLEYDSDYSTPWERTIESLQTEWNGHALFAWASPRAQNIDFDNKEEGEPLGYYINKAWNAFIG